MAAAVKLVAPLVAVCTPIWSAAAAVACETTRSHSKFQFAASNGSPRLSPVMVCSATQEEIVPPVPQVTSAPVTAMVCAVLTNAAVLAAAPVPKSNRPAAPRLMPVSSAVVAAPDPKPNTLPDGSSKRDPVMRTSATPVDAHNQIPEPVL